VDQLFALSYLYDAANSVEVGQTDAELAHYSQGASINEPLAALRGGTVGFYEQDGLGSVTSLSGATGSLTNSYTYDSFNTRTGTRGWG
jgi:hypothetical protein